MKTGNCLSAAVAAALLAACGSSGDGESVTSQLLDPSRLAALLSPEAKAAVEAYEGDVRAGIAAHKAQFGQLPQSLADIPSAVALRETSVNLIADGLAEQVPFASRETVEKAATAFVGTAERHVFDQMKAQDAPNP